MASWNKLTYPRRLFLWLLGYSLLMVTCFVLFQYHREKDFKAAELDARLQIVNAYIINEIDSGRNVSQMNLDELMPVEGLRVSIIRRDGTVVYDNSLDTLPGTNHQNRKEIREAITKGSGYTLRRHSESTGQNYFYSARLGNDDTVVRTAVPYSVSLSELLRADRGFLWVMGLITLLMCIIGYVATRKLGLNIMRLRRFAADAESGRRICDTGRFPHDELGDISSHIIRLYTRLQQALADRDTEHRAALHQQQEKERIKKQLTNNINHELKTPVAAIRVCVETLLAHENLPEEKRRDFLRRCLANAGRLGNLLADVSLITRMDDGGSAITRQPASLSAIIGDVVAECAPLALAAGIDINYGSEGDYRLMANRNLMESVFRNLIDNAVAYSGGTAIDIAAAPAPGGKVTVTLCDNGCGVPPEHLPHLFERFYRIDKGRSRAAGGTGLGLAIVRNAVALHGGTISVANREGGGLLFTITLPLIS